MNESENCYIVLEKQFHPLVGKMLICATCNATYQPTEDERVCGMNLYDTDGPESCDLCGTSLTTHPKPVYITARTSDGYAPVRLRVS